MLELANARRSKDNVSVIVIAVFRFFMYKFTASVLCFAICQASFAAGIVIEEKSLSKSPTPEPVNSTRY
jgi:hypothetical protein